VSVLGAARGGEHTAQVTLARLDHPQDGRETIRPNYVVGIFIQGGVIALDLPSSRFIVEIALDKLPQSTEGRIRVAIGRRTGAGSQCLGIFSFQDGVFRLHHCLVGQELLKPLLHGLTFIALLLNLRDLLLQCRVLFLKFSRSIESFLLQL